MLTRIWKRGQTETKVLENEIRWEGSAHWKGDFQGPLSAVHTPVARPLEVSAGSGKREEPGVSGYRGLHGSGRTGPHIPQMEGRHPRLENLAALPCLAEPVVEILEPGAEGDEIGLFRMFQHEVGSL